MPDRQLMTAWPAYVNSTGQAGTGTKVTAELLDAIRDAVSGAVYDANLSDDPPSIAREVVAARAAYANLAARLTAIESAAAGGAAASAASSAQLNLVPNDTFLIWSAGDSGAPDGWAKDAGAGTLAISREATTAGSSLAAYAGRNAVKLVADAPKEFFIEIVSAAELSTLNAASFLKARKVAAGIAVHASTQNLVEVHIDSGAGTSAATKVGSNYGTANAWVWSAAGHAGKGGLELPSAPTRLRLVVKMVGAGTAYVQAPAFYFSETAPFWVPAPSRVGTMLFGVDTSGQIPSSAFDVARFTPPRSIHLLDATLRCATAPGATAVVANVYRGADLAFTLNSINVVAGQTVSSVVAPISRALASFGPSHVLRVQLATSDATARGAWLALRYIEFPRAIESALYGA